MDAYQVDWPAKQQVDFSKQVDVLGDAAKAIVNIVLFAKEHSPQTKNVAGHENAEC